MQRLGVVIVDDGEGFPDFERMSHGEDAGMTLAGGHNADVDEGGESLGFGHGGLVSVWPRKGGAGRRPDTRLNHA